MIPNKDLKQITNLVKRDILGRIANVMNKKEINNVKITMIPATLPN